jgi:hypothetical protein
VHHQYIAIGGDLGRLFIGVGSRPVFNERKEEKKWQD